MIKLKSVLLLFAISAMMTVLISSIAGVAGLLFHSSFWGWFSIALIIQLILGYFWNQHLDRTAGVEILSLQNKFADITNRQTIELNCAYCNFKNLVNIVLNKDNQFTCPNCQQINKINIKFTTLRTTTVLEPDRVLKELLAKAENEESTPLTSIQQSAINSNKIQIS